MVLKFSKYTGMSMKKKSLYSLFKLYCFFLSHSSIVFQYSMHGVALCAIISYFINNKLDSNKLCWPSSAVKCVVPDLVKYNLFLLVIVEIVTFYFIRLEIYIHSFILPSARPPARIQPGKYTLPRASPPARMQPGKKKYTLPSARPPARMQPGKKK